MSGNRTADPLLVRATARPGGRPAQPAAPQRRGARAARRCRRRTSASSPARSSCRCSRTTPAARSPTAGRRRPRTRRSWSPRRSTPPCSASGGSSRCWRTPRSRTSTSTAATASSSATPTAARSCPTRSPRATRSWSSSSRSWPPRVGLASRPFDSANPQLDLRLPDGSRLSAVMAVCSRPSVSIRRSRLGKVSLEDLVGNGTLTPQVAAFLKAAVRARKNIMIAGSTNSGKTTLLRALAGEIPSHERLITVERALELGLDQFEDQHPNAVAFEERLPNSEGVGGVTMAELVRRSLRQNPSPGHRRRGPRRRDRHDAQRDEPGQRRLAVDDPREHLDGGVQPHRHLRPPGGGAAAGRGHPHADLRLRSTSWSSCASVNDLQRGRGPAPRRGVGARGHRRRRAGPVQRGVRARAPTAAPSRTRRSSCIDDLVEHGYEPPTMARWA